jgi:hypothetical protein
MTGGSKVSIAYMGIANKRGDVITLKTPEGEKRLISLDQFGKDEGFGDWKGFLKNQKWSESFISEKESRHMYEIVPASAVVSSTTTRPEYDKLPAPSGTPTMTYAGVGSRNTPPEVLKQMTELAKELEKKGYTLNTGDAVGADTAFGKGTNKKTVFTADDATNKTRVIAKEIHPKPDALAGKSLDLQARNTNQVFGKNLDTPVDFIVVWTPNGETRADQRVYFGKTSDKNTGGTGQAIALAQLKGITVINMANSNWRTELDNILSGKPKQTSGWARTSPNGYEVSSKGDRRFSAFYAKLDAFDGDSIEEVYQTDVKGYKTIDEGKGKPPLNNMTKEESYEAYKGLWVQWAKENPALIEELRVKSAGKVLTDMFATTDINQARALSEILNEGVEEAYPFLPDDANTVFSTASAEMQAAVEAAGITDWAVDKVSAKVKKELEDKYKHCV